MSFFELENEQTKLCEKCKLCSETPGVMYTGNGEKKILLIYGFPVDFPAERSELLRQIKQTFFDCGLNYRKDCWETHAVIGKKGSTPTLAQINYCRNVLKRTIKKSKPEKIITFGKTAITGLIGDKVSISSIEQWTGWKIPDQDYKAWIYPTYGNRSLSIVEGKESFLPDTFKANLFNAINHKEEFPVHGDPVDNNEILDTSMVAFDIETTGIKPYSKGHEIISISFTFAENKTTSILLDCEENIEYAKRILENPNIKKIAQNMKFEDSWLRNILGINVKNWYWDTMIATHVLDNRSGITSLKFQAYVNFGVAGYDKYCADFMLPGSHTINRLKEADQAKVLKYNGLDSYFTYKLAELQMKKMNVKTGFNLFMQGMIELSKIEDNGINVDSKYIAETRIKMGEKIKSVFSNIQNDPIVKEMGGLNPASPKQLKELFFDRLKLKPIKATAKGNASTDAETLEQLDHPLARQILKHKKYKKLDGTYLSTLQNEEVYGVLHPSFNLHVARTYRSSCSNPNTQNWPKRDEHSLKIIRSAIIPKPGFQIMEVDYSGIEVRIAACYNEDKNLIAYINDPESDMHRDMAQEIFMTDNVTKEQRYLAKNKFVFPEFYGSWYSQIAENFWKDFDSDQRSHWRNYRSFEKHIADIEYNFWNVRFKKYKKWKERTWQLYLEHGFIQTKTGFTCRGVMKRNDALNYAIQGSAFHCLLWSLITLNKYLSLMKLKSHIIGQIHDSIIFNIWPEEKDVLKPIIRRIMCEDIREHWDWIIVPLDIEATITDVDGNWAKINEEKI